MADSYLLKLQISTHHSDGVQRKQDSTDMHRIPGYRGSQRLSTKTGKICGHKIHYKTQSEHCANVGDRCKRCQVSVCSNHVHEEYGDEHQATVGSQRHVKTGEVHNHLEGK